jgi:GNAT superfamily N-acetyltransferase
LVRNGLGNFGEQERHGVWRLPQRVRSTGDAGVLSDVISTTIWRANASDYTVEILDGGVPMFSPRHISEALATSEVLVAILDDRIVGTGGLSDCTVWSVYVLPEEQGRGIGRHLMPGSSSITALEFYAERGFVSIRNEEFSGARVNVMEK